MNINEKSFRIYEYSSKNDEKASEDLHYLELKRYSHDSFGPKFNKKYSNYTSTQAKILCFVCVFAFFIVMSQIYLLHKSDKPLIAQEIDVELKLMDETMDNMLKSKNVLTIKQWISMNEERRALKRFQKVLNSTYRTNCNEYLGISNFKIQARLNYEKKFDIILKLIDKNINVNYKLNFNDCILSFYLANNSNEILNYKFSCNFCLNFKSDNNLKIEWNNSNERILYEIYDERLLIFYLPIYSLMNTISQANKKIQLCDNMPSKLVGKIMVNETEAGENYINLLNNLNTKIQSGGRWKPDYCLARHRVAIIIPYRDRLNHLRILLSYLHEILQRQELEYQIFVAEQFGNGTYNKGILMNSAFIYAQNEYDFDCYCFHDVDLIPEDDRNMYSCPEFARHMSPAVDELNYKLLYEELVGGVLNLRKEHLLAVNGYSNLFWGWGAEDDDMFYRLKSAGIKVLRPPYNIGRYKMSKHKKRKPQSISKRAKLLYSSANRMIWDGISSVKYQLLNVTKNKLFTHLLIDVGQPPRGFE